MRQPAPSFAYGWLGWSALPGASCGENLCRDADTGPELCDPQLRLAEPEPTRVASKRSLLIPGLGKRLAHSGLIHQGPRQCEPRERTQGSARSTPAPACPRRGAPAQSRNWRRASGTNFGLPAWVADAGSSSPLTALPAGRKRAASGSPAPPGG
jgi:hypothetical protein